MSHSAACSANSALSPAGLRIPDQLKLYCARHTFGTVAMAETKDPGLVRETMGHSDLKTTMAYMHPDIYRVKDIIDKRNASKMVQ
jgi:integrase